MPSNEKRDLNHQLHLCPIRIHTSNIHYLSHWVWVPLDAQKETVFSVCGKVLRNRKKEEGWKAEGCGMQFPNCPGSLNFTREPPPPDTFRLIYPVRRIVCTQNMISWANYLNWLPVFHISCGLESTLHAFNCGNLASSEEQCIIVITGIYYIAIFIF